LTGTGRGIHGDDFRHRGQGQLDADVDRLCRAQLDRPMHGSRMTEQRCGHRVGAGVQSDEIEPTDLVGDRHRDDVGSPGGV